MAQKKEKTVRNIGIEVNHKPKKMCDDRNCPFCGHLPLRGKQFVGTVVKSRMQNSCVVEWERRRYNRKYERYMKVKTKIKTHNSPCIDAKEGDVVRVMETRPLSKTIHTVIIEKVENASS